VAEDVGRVEALSRDVEVQGADEFGGDLIEDLCGGVDVAEESLIAFEGARAERGARLGVQGILDVGAKDVSLDGLLRVLAEEVGEEDQAGHGIKFFGGGAQGVAEVFRQLADGQDLEGDMSNDPLPSVGDELPSGRRDDPFEGVEESVLSRVDGVGHGRRNSFSWIQISIERRRAKSREKWL
jgi:hypothetical protein